MRIDLHLNTHTHKHYWCANAGKCMVAASLSGCLGRYTVWEHKWSSGQNCCGDAEHTIKQPPLLMKINLTWLRHKCSQTRYRSPVFPILEVKYDNQIKSTFNLGKLVGFSGWTLLKMWVNVSTQLNHIYNKGVVVFLSIFNSEFLPIISLIPFAWYSQYKVNHFFLAYVYFWLFSKTCHGFFRGLIS